MIEKLLNSQKKYFKSGETKNISFRIRQLKKLKEIILGSEDRIIKAISRDMRRPDTEIYTSEIYTVIYELELFIKKLKKWTAPKKVKTPLALQPATSRVHLEPLGTVLIMAPWNYPFQLLLAPLIGAVAAGNCVVAKPSEVSSETAGVIASMIRENFHSEYIGCVEGGPDRSRQLVKQPFDHIFFTGSRKTGREVLKSAAENLTPVTLELGGKCPCIVTQEAAVKKSARRIAWGKFFNAGQTCLAPDYIMAHHSIKEELIKEIKQCVKDFYGEEPFKSKDYGRIINEKHFDRVVGLVREKELSDFNTDRDHLYIPPTVIDDVSPDDDIMKEEIFGPLLPVLGYGNIKEVEEYLSRDPWPLNIYIFTSGQKKVKDIISTTSSGAVSVNDVLIQAFSPYLPFGGVGKSGSGKYRGRSSLVTFSNRKSVMKRSTFFDFDFRYPPYKTAIVKLKKYLKILR
ncbi:MAG: aldehyde dehydrogenase family protein [Elusimicrobiota bacterium]